MTKNKLVIYTALFGDYDKLIDPKEKYSGCDFVCFTDQKKLKSKIWKIVLIDKCDLEPNMMNRKYKILPHNFLYKYDKSLYIDSNIRMLSDPTELFNIYLSNDIIAVPNHGRRNCIYEEANKVIQVNKAPSEIVLNQIKYYKSLNYPKQNGLFEMNIIFRQHNNTHAIKIMNDWWDQINTHSQRDQLSFCYVLWNNNTQVKTINESSRKINKYFWADCHKFESRKSKIKNILKRKLHFIKNLKSKI